MKSFKLGLVAAALVATAGAAMADGIDPYVNDSASQIVMSGSNTCVRNSWWTPALAQQSKAGCKCDADIVSCVAAPVKKAKPKKVVMNADALFDFGSSRVSAEGVKSLNKLVSELAGVDVQVVLITGYTDNIGSEAVNVALSKKRAEAVADYLANAGVNADALRPDGLGADNPVVECKEAKRADQIKCLAPNRRAEIEVFGTRAAQ